MATEEVDLVDRRDQQGQDDQPQPVCFEAKPGKGVNAVGEAIQENHLNN